MKNCEYRTAKILVFLLFFLTCWRKKVVRFLHVFHTNHNVKFCVWSDCEGSQASHCSRICTELPALITTGTGLCQSLLWGVRESYQSRKYGAKPTEYSRIQYIASAHLISPASQTRVQNNDAVTGLAISSVAVPPKHAFSADKGSLTIWLSPNRKPTLKLHLKQTFLVFTPA